MKRVFVILFCALLIGCSEERSLIRIEAWHELDRPVEEYRKLQPDRPILVFYTADWDAMGQLAQKYLNEPRFFDLFTHFQVLPLIADCTDLEGVAGREFQRTYIKGVAIHCFLLSRPSKENSWFPVGVVSSDALYETLKTELAP